MRGLHSANSNSEMSGYPATMRFLRDSPVNLKAPNGVVWWWRCELISLRFHPVHNIWSRSSYAWCGLTRAHISKDGCHMMSLNSSGLNQQQKKTTNLWNLELTCSKPPGQLVTSPSSRFSSPVNCPGTLHSTKLAPECRPWLSQKSSRTLKNHQDATHGEAMMVWLLSSRLQYVDLRWSHHVMLN